MSHDVQLVGWDKTPQASDAEGGVMEIRPGTTGKYKLRDYAILAGWPTSRGQHGCGPSDVVSRGLTPEGAARLTGWPTTTTRDCKDKGLDAPNRTGGPSLPGLITELFLVPTGNIAGVRGTRPCLNPFFSLWLMGFPLSWAIAGMRIPKKSKRG